jgi:hypothetical protein
VVAHMRAVGGLRQRAQFWQQAIQEQRPCRRGGNGGCGCPRLGSGNVASAQRHQQRLGRRRGQHGLHHAQPAEGGEARNLRRQAAAARTQHNRVNRACVKQRHARQHGLVRATRVGVILSSSGRGSGARCGRASIAQLRRSERGGRSRHRVSIRRNRRIGWRTRRRKQRRGQQRRGVCGAEAHACAGR